MVSDYKISYGPLIGAVDQGTSSTRFLVFSANTGKLVTYHQVTIDCHYPHEGWVEQNPLDLLQSVEICIQKAVENLKLMDIDPDDIKAVGITNQRETTIVWDKSTGLPICNAIVWLDARNASTVEDLIAKTPTGKSDYLADRCGLPISTYFSATKLRWLIDNDSKVKNAIIQRTCLFGTVDSWLIWNLTGGAYGGYHVTDVSNASRTMLMNLETLQWDPTICQFFDIPLEILPEIKSSAELYGNFTLGPLQNVPICGCLGDQQAALVGHGCFREGQAKNTFGTGCFLLYNTGGKICHSTHGLLSTVAFQLGRNELPVYALEGSVAIAGAVVSWLKDNLNFIQSSSEVETLASTVTNSGGVYFVPAFSGLFAPYWEMDARGVICGLTQYTTKAHIARAALEAVAYQVKDIIIAVQKDSGIALQDLWVDGGMTNNDLLMQIQADLLGIKVVRPSMVEITALGAAMAAGHAMGLWKSESFIVHSSATFHPSMNMKDVFLGYNKWKMAINRSLGWEKDCENSYLPAGIIAEP